MTDLPSSTETGRDEAAIDWQCFAYLTAERGAVYRAMVDVFAAAKAEFSLHLRATEIRAALARQDLMLDITDVDSALQQLQAWGNLQSYQDNADVASLTEYYRKRLLYQLSTSGEAAYASTLTFAERLQQQAKLDARALERIAAGAGQLERFAEELVQSPDSVDSVKLLATMRELARNTDDLTSRAQSFFRWLHDQTESGCGDLDAFLAYKEQLIEYLQQFISELITRGGEIAGRLNRIEDNTWRRLAELTAIEEIGAPRVGEENSHAEQVDEVTNRWVHKVTGLCGWFSRRGTRPAQLEQLRAAARTAIPRLLQLAAQMNDRQAGRSDRLADLQILAVRFLSCRDNAEAHQLFRAAFVLSSSRHLRVDQETLESRDQSPVAATRRWLDAEPIFFAPQLRNTGRQPAAASNRRIVDRTEGRTALNRKLSLEKGRNESARETMIALGRRRLSEIGSIDRDAFRLLLELIERAVPNVRGTSLSVIRTSPVSTDVDVHRAVRHPDDSTTTTAKSRDGSVRMTASPCANQLETSGYSSGSHINGSHANGLSRKQNATDCVARIRTAGGELMMPDMWMEVTRVQQA